MKISITIIGILSTGLLLVAANNFKGAKTQEQNLHQLVQDAIREATSQYDEMMHQATIHGAQSQRHTREAIKSTETTQDIGRISMIYRDAFNQLTQKFQVNQKTALKLLRNELPQQYQPFAGECDANAVYRTVDGTCNNIQNPSWGSVNMPCSRLLNPAYADGIKEPRGGGGNSTLPPARKISFEVHLGNGTSYEPNVTHMAAQFGQFIDHDITLTPVNSLQCCGNPAASTECWTIDVQDDTHYKTHNVTCLDFVRSTERFPSSGDNEHREQFNGITAYIDGSVVYSSNETIFRYLRGIMKDGKLAENAEHPGFIPWRSEVVPGDTAKTVIGGDVRANEMPGLTVMHSLFLREHNRIADELGQLTDWDDEKIFQETRRIITAELQQITYDEFLPAMLGLQAMKDYNLELPRDHTEYTKYDSSVDATILNMFATAAYRFGHTLVNGLIQLYMDKTIVGQYNVRDNYLISDRIINNNIQGKSGYELILNGLIRQTSQAYDQEIHGDMTNHLFQTAQFVGSDLAARNIQRGRDHGIPSYNEFRKHCNLTELPATWTSPPSEISAAAWTKLQNARYASPQDIDLYTGGLSELHVAGALSGPTFVCLQAIQFQRLMKGDRFFFTHANVSGAFSPDQLAALRGRTLGDIICQNSAIKEAARNVFYVESQLNPMIPCDKDSRKLNVQLFSSATTTSLATSATLFISLFCSFTVGRIIPKIF